MRRILKPGRNCWGIYDVWETVKALDYYRAFYSAAEAAQHYILIAGWQFDTEVQLLRGDDRKEPDQEVRLYPFLRGLCERNPKLSIYILAWDFSIVYAMSREWFQEWRFTWGASSQIKFYFDITPSALVIIKNLSLWTAASPLSGGWISVPVDGMTAGI